VQEEMAESATLTAQKCNLAVEGLRLHAVLRTHPCQ
jgi:hypothetical protein